MIAIRKRNLNLIKLLAKKGANVNYKDDSGKTSLLYAYRGNHKDIFYFLKSNGAIPYFIYQTIIFLIMIFFFIHFTYLIFFHKNITDKKMGKIINFSLTLIFVLIGLYFINFNYLIPFIKNDTLIFLLLITLSISYPFIYKIIIYKNLLSMHFKKCLCPNCYLYSNHIEHKVSFGIRSCNNCKEDIENGVKKNLMIVFGNIITQEKPASILCKNKDFSNHKVTTNIESIYIDIKTVDVTLLDSFLTYTSDYQPYGEIKNIPVYYQGNLEDLGQNRINIIKNNFKCLQEMENYG